MEITSITTEKAIIIYVEGDLTTASSPEAQEEIDEILEGKDDVNVIINVAKVNFIASTGLRIILVLGKRLGGAGGKLAVCEMNATTKSVFNMSGFTKLFPVYDTEEEAMGQL